MSRSLRLLNTLILIALRTVICVYPLWDGSEIKDVQASVTIADLLI